MSDHESPEPFCEMTGPMPDPLDLLQIQSERNGWLACELQAKRNLIALMESNLHHAKNPEYKTGFLDAIEAVNRMLSEIRPVASELCSLCLARHRSVGDLCRTCATERAGER